MLHGFREGTDNNGGQEVFAFVPRAVLGKLYKLAAKPYVHDFFVDGPLSLADAYIPAPNATLSNPRWTSILLGNLGAGGRAVYALDVTTPLSMNEQSVLWEIDADSGEYSDLGYAMNEVQAGVTVGGAWVALFGNGKYSDSGKAYLFVVNLANGKLIRKISTDDSDGNGLMGVNLVRNGFNQIVGAYAGDLHGKIWRFDLSNENAASWPAAAMLFQATDSNNAPQPITAAPIAIPRKDGRGVMVVFATGKLFDAGDDTNHQNQSAYGIWDQASFGATGGFSPVNTRSQLVQVTLNRETDISKLRGGAQLSSTLNLNSFFNTSASRAVDWTSDRGWYINFPDSLNLRSISAPQSLGNSVVIGAVSPLLNCTPAWNVMLLVDPLAGTCNASQSSVDTNGDGTLDSADSNACALTTYANGALQLIYGLDSSGRRSGLGYALDASGKAVKLRFEPDTTPDCAGAACLLRRDWRQIFPRQ
jgi:type IV pilus assembly protein PilY1